MRLCHRRVRRGEFILWPASQPLVDHGFHSGVCCGNLIGTGFTHANCRLTWYVSAVYSSPVSLLYNMMGITGAEEAV